jgi:hypothetical protein
MYKNFTKTSYGFKNSLPKSYQGSKKFVLSKSIDNSTAAASQVFGSKINYATIT